MMDPDMTVGFDGCGDDVTVFATRRLPDGTTRFQQVHPAPPVVHLPDVPFPARPACDVPPIDWPEMAVQWLQATADVQLELDDAQLDMVRNTYQRLVDEGKLRAECF